MYAQETEYTVSASQYLSAWLKINNEMFVNDACSKTDVRCVQDIADKTHVGYALRSRYLMILFWDILYRGVRIKIRKFKAWRSINKAEAVQCCLISSSKILQYSTKDKSLWRLFVVEPNLARCQPRDLHLEKWAPTAPWSWWRRSHPPPCSAGWGWGICQILSSVRFWKGETWAS